MRSKIRSIGGSKYDEYQKFKHNIKFRCCQIITDFKFLSLIVLHISTFDTQGKSGIDNNLFSVFHIFRMGKPINHFHLIAGDLFIFPINLFSGLNFEEKKIADSDLNLNSFFKMKLKIN